MLISARIVFIDKINDMQYKCTTRKEMMSTANRSGQWRYRIGDYGLLADIQDNKLTIIVIEIGHRSKIYDD